MTNAPEKLCFVNCGLPADQCACYRHYLNATFLPTILASEHDRIVAEKDAEIARLREALLDATAHLIAAAASYRTYARRGGDIRPRAEVDAFFTTRARDYDRAAERARAALGDDNG